jgi:DNA-directed RNA polymerase subunit M/transcription elongation factor TFIIS
MVNFCKYCHNRLESIYISDELNLKCFKCSLYYKSSDEDSLRFERIKESDIQSHQTILNKAAADPAVMKVKLACISSKCKGQIAKQVRIGENALLYCICITCNEQWIYN